MTELAELYKQAEEMVLFNYATVKDEKGRSQAWKLEVLKEERISNNRSSVVEEFLKDVESTVDRLEKAVKEVKKQEETLEKLVGQMPQVATKPPTNNAELGIDREWD